ncbi:hypothetical protein KDL45_06075 [bacterium]|nr:hypothetical protein [bacterium]
MSSFRGRVIVVVVAAAVSMFASSAFAQGTAGQSSPPPGTVGDTMVVSDAALPWFVMTGRIALGGGSGTAEYDWDVNFIEDLVGDVGGKETVDIEDLSHGAFIAEAFFMPTKARHFILSAALSLGGGNGTAVSNDVFDDEDYSYVFRTLSVGLGYQWFFGPKKNTNLFAMTHLGWGAYAFTVNFRGAEETSRAMGAFTYDLSVGSWHRFDSGFTLGGSLDYWALSYSGRAGDGGIIDTEVNGSQYAVRLNALAGWSW